MGKVLLYPTSSPIFSIVTNQTQDILIVANQNGDINTYLLYNPITVDSFLILLSCFNCVEKYRDLGYYANLQKIELLEDFYSIDEYILALNDICKIDIYTIYGKILEFSLGCHIGTFGNGKFDISDQSTWVSTKKESSNSLNYPGRV